MPHTKSQMYGTTNQKRGVLGTVLSNIKSNVTLPEDIIKYRSQAFLSNRKTDAIKGKFKNEVKEFLPTVPMGQDAYNKAVGEVNKLVNSGKYKGAAQYANDQLKTMSDQSVGNTKGTRSQKEYLNNLLIKLKQRFPSVK